MSPHTTPSSSQVVASNRFVFVCTLGLVHSSLSLSFFSIHKLSVEVWFAPKSAALLVETLPFSGLAFAYAPPQSFSFAPIADPGVVLKT